jgi:hypothetical protein
MSESIAEMVLPGTYIEVRAEGLISVGSIATGNIGIVGTAARGPVDTVVQLGGAAETLDLFGPPDSFTTPAEAGVALTLVRALNQVFAGGGSTVYAVRIAGGQTVAASAVVPASTNEAFRLTARDTGSWGNDIKVTVADNGAAVAPRFRLVVEYRNQREAFEGNNVSQVRTALDEARLVTVSDPPGTAAGGTANLAAGTLSLTGGLSLPNVNASHVAAGLERLEDQPINIVLVAGLGASVVGAPLLAHVERTENDGRERIAVLGATSSDPAVVVNDVGGLGDDRTILVAPGIKVSEPDNPGLVSLPPAYTAGLVAGRLGSIAPHISLTNQVLPIGALDVNYTTPVHKNLLLNNVLAVRRRFGHQVVRGITTDSGAFRQISIRRIVDFAKAGVRLGSNPYIGKLNNARVRAALKATLDGFLSQMVLDEMLVGYQLTVTATRPQEIAGVAIVTMTLQPTFSIDFIRVTMNLE